MKIPVVVLVVGGGPRTIKLVYESISKGTPCVLLESSGESADIICFALKKNDEILNNNNDSNSQKEKTSIGNKEINK